MALVFTRSVGPLGCNMVIIADPITRDALLVDPGGDAADIISIIETHSLKVVQILITHAHLDHILASDEMRKYTGAECWFHAADKKLWLSVPLQCMFMGVPQPSKPMKVPEHNLEDGDTLQVRNGVTLFTPGHTQGSLCFYFPDDKLVCTGDTLFAGSVGRTDLPGGNSNSLMASIRQKLLILPNDTRVLPGHGPETTIGNEKLSNPFLQ